MILSVILPMHPADLLSEYGYDVAYEEIPGYAHEWAFWDLALKKALDEKLPIKNDVILP